MEALNRSTSMKRFTLNGKEIAFNPGDIEWAEKFTQMLDNIEKIAMDSDTTYGSNAEFFRKMREKNVEIRNEIDSLFGEGTAEAYYDSNYFNKEQGFPVWVDFTVDILDEVYNNQEEQDKIAQDRYAKYTKKYEKYRRKRK